MTNVTITVRTIDGGNVEVEESSSRKRLGESDTQFVAELLDRAVAKVRSAYDISKHLGSCDHCHMHSSRIGDRCNVYVRARRCEGYIRECCCGGNSVRSFRNDPAPRPPSTPADMQPANEQKDES